MKALIFDAGPVISLTTNNLLWLLEDMQESFDGVFYITAHVKNELVEKPLNTKKFKFEALQVKRLLDQGIIRVYHHEKLAQLSERIFELANRIYSVRGNLLNIVHYAESEVMAAAMILDASAIAVDERTTRYLIETPDRLAEIFKKKLHVPVKINKEALADFRGLVKGINVIRSVEIVTVAFEKGLLDDYITNIPHPRKTLIESVLWGVKLHGCAISHREIDRIVKLEMKRKA